MPIIPPHGTRDMRSEVLPATLLPLFTDEFVQSCDLIEEYIYRLALAVFRELGCAEVTTEATTVSEIVNRCDLAASCAEVPLEWLMRLLTRRGVLTRSGSTPPAYQIVDEVPALDPEEIRAQQESHDARALPSFDIAKVAADAYPDCLSGKLKGEQALFAPARLALWSKYFSNDNPLYEINNRIPALDAVSGGSFRSVLELGGGLGSAGVALLDGLAEAGRLDEVVRYRFTDVSPVFLRRGERAVRGSRDGDWLKASRLDIDRDFVAQLKSPEEFDLVFAVNTVHVAKDLEHTLGQIYQCLRPGGRLVFGECVRPFEEQPLYTELVFLLLESFRNPVLHSQWRPTGGFLTTEQWTAALENTGFTEVAILPDIGAIRPHYDNFVVASLSAKRPT